MAHSILVVDDDPHIRDVIRFAFEKAGMTISIAQDGKEALRQFDRAVHELVVLDIGMPEMDGLEVCRQIRKTSGYPDPVPVGARRRDRPRARPRNRRRRLRDQTVQPARTGGAGQCHPAAGAQRAGGARRPSEPLRHGALAIDPDARMRGVRRQAGRADRARIRDPAHAAGAAGIRVHARADPGRRLCRQHPCRRPHHRQPCPQHPRQDGGGGLRERRSRPCMASASGSGAARRRVDATPPPCPARNANGGRR